MSRGVNKVILIGNLGNDPEIRHLAGGAAVANISLATSEQWKDKETGEKQEKVEWHKVTFFGRLAEVVGEYLHKGSQVFVEGRLQTDKWQDKDGVDRYTTKIIASQMQMLGGKRQHEEDDGEEYPEQESLPETPAHKQKSRSPAMADGDFDDDIPF